MQDSAHRDQNLNLGNTGTFSPSSGPIFLFPLFFGQLPLLLFSYNVHMPPKFVCIRSTADLETRIQVQAVYLRGTPTNAGQGVESERKEGKEA